MAPAPSLRAHGLRIGALECGPRDTITDVAGVRVGHVTVVRDEPDPPAGRGFARTGVTAIVPAEPDTLFAAPLAAGTAVLNGAGELTGSLQVAEWGVLETPVYLTATMSVGRVYDGAVAAAVAADPAVGVDSVVIPVVGECDDSWLNDARVVQVEAADAGRALDGAGEDVAQGAVGAGTGMVCFDYKGGIGTASRVVAGATVGVLALTNFGSAEQLRVDGVPVGRLLHPPEPRRSAAGSCIVVVATDAPLLSAQLTRVARRRPRSRPHRLARPPRQRRDLPRVLHPARTRRPRRPRAQPALRGHRRRDRGGRPQRAMGGRDDEGSRGARGPRAPSRPRP
jgi:D-aminopeptidase